MKAIRFARFGEPRDVLEIATIEKPRLVAGEVLVEIAGASINPSDVKNVQGAMHGTMLPRTPGRDFAGTVLEGPAELIGREVWGAGGDVGFTRDGSHAEYLAVPAGGVRLKPERLSAAEAAAAGINFITAWMGLEAIGLGAGETIAVTGASGGVGSSVVQLARWRGATTLGIDVHPLGSEAPAWLRPDHVVASGDGAADGVRAATHGRGVDCVYDTVGAPLFAQTRDMLRERGRWAIIASQGPREVAFDVIAFYRKELQLFGIDSRKLDTVACAAILERLAPGFASGTLHPPHIAQTRSLDDAVAAYEAVRDGTAHGKVVFAR